MGRLSANDVYNHFKSCTKTIGDEKYLQISSDGPNVNIALLDILNESRSDVDVGRKC